MSKPHYLVMQRQIVNRINPSLSRMEAFVQRIEATTVLNFEVFLSVGYVAIRVCDTKAEAENIAASWNKKFQENRS